MGCFGLVPCTAAGRCCPCPFPVQSSKGGFRAGKWRARPPPDGALLLSEGEAHNRRLVQTPSRQCKDVDAMHAASIHDMARLALGVAGGQSPCQFGHAKRRRRASFTARLCLKGGIFGRMCTTRWTYLHRLPAAFSRHLMPFLTVSLHELLSVTPWAGTPRPLPVWAHAPLSAVWCWGTRVARITPIPGTFPQPPVIQEQHAGVSAPWDPIDHSEDQGGPAQGEDHELTRDAGPGQEWERRCVDAAAAARRMRILHPASAPKWPPHKRRWKWLGRIVPHTHGCTTLQEASKRCGTSGVLALAGQPQSGGGVRSTPRMLSWPHWSEVWSTHPRSARA